MNYAENKAAAADFGVAKVIGGRFFLRRGFSAFVTKNAELQIQGTGSVYRRAVFR